MNKSLLSIVEEAIAILPDVSRSYSENDILFLLAAAKAKLVAAVRANSPTKPSDTGRIQRGEFTAEINLELLGREWEIPVVADYSWEPPDHANGRSSGEIEVDNLRSVDSELQVVINMIPVEIDLRAAIEDEIIASGESSRRCGRLGISRGSNPFDSEGTLRKQR